MRLKGNAQKEAESISLTVQPENLKQLYGKIQEIKEEKRYHSFH